MAAGSGILPPERLHSPFSSYTMDKSCRDPYGKPTADERPILRPIGALILRSAKPAGSPYDVIGIPGNFAEMPIHAQESASRLQDRQMADAMLLPAEDPGGTAGSQAVP